MELSRLARTLLDALLSLAPAAARASDHQDGVDVFSEAGLEEVFV